MNVTPKSRERKRLLWPAAGIVIGAAVATNPVYAPHFSLGFGIAVWGVAMLLAFLLSGYPVGARVAALMTGLLLAVPCFVRDTPLSRGLLMCCMFAPVAIAAALVAVPPIPDYRRRLAYLFAWSGTQQLKRYERRCDGTALLQLVTVTVALAIAIAAVKVIPASGLWLIGRWFTGGIMVLIFAEMATAGLVLIPAALGVIVPPLMQSPYRAASVTEFWSNRWNLFASQMVFRPFFFVPLARRGVALALGTVFLASGVAHLLLAYMATGKWPISLACGAFFVVQPILIAIERRFNVRRRRPAVAHAWTLAALTITSPLFVEPALQIIEPSWGAPDTIVLPTAATFGFIVGFCVFVSTASLLAQSSEAASAAPHNSPAT